MVIQSHLKVIPNGNFLTNTQVMPNMYLNCIIYPSEMDELVKVAIFMVLFGILLPTFDTYSDGYFSYSLISGTYCESSNCTKHPIYGSVMLIPVLLAMLFTIPHWWRREKSWNRLYTLPLLIFQVWPQWQVIKVKLVF